MKTCNCSDLVIFILFNVISQVLGQYKPYYDPHCEDGRVVIVHLFEWKWTDIALECERFLGPNNFCGVQLSPPEEHAIIMEPFRPWWERYQPVSYQLHSRSGNETEFIDMVQRCNTVGVRIFPDVVLNHFAEVHRSGYGSGGSYYEAGNGLFTGVPFTMDNFHNCDICGQDCWVWDYYDWTDVRICRFGWLIDVNQSNPESLQKQADFLNHMIDIGVAGFRVDASRFISRRHFWDMYNLLHNLTTTWFPEGSLPFFVHEVPDTGEIGTIRALNYTELGMVTEFFYGTRLKDAVDSSLYLLEDIYNPEIGMVPPESALIFVDNHDTQRGHGVDNDVLTHKTPREYKIGQVITVGSSYGLPRVMSSYFFEDGDAGPPMDKDMTTEDVIIYENGTCGNGWVCEHRWPAISGIVRFAGAAKNAPMGQRQYLQNGTAVAYARGNEGFVVATTTTPLDVTLYTALPPGRYINMLLSCNPLCEMVEVREDGFARIYITDNEEPFVALHTSYREE